MFPSNIHHENLEKSVWPRSGPPTNLVSEMHYPSLQNSLAMANLPSTHGGGDMLFKFRIV
jgi:hypothetical protein